jgi:hypothetical protein
MQDVQSTVEGRKAFGLGLVAPARNPSTQEVETERSRFERKRLERPCLEKQAG